MQFKNLTLTGNYYADEFSFIEINLNICYDKPHCAPVEEIEAYFYPNIAKLAYVFTNSFIDYNKQERQAPIKLYADDKIFYPLDLRKQTQTNFYIRESHLRASSSWWKIG